MTKFLEVVHLTLFLPCMQRILRRGSKAYYTRGFFLYNMRGEVWTCHSFLKMKYKELGKRSVG